jgi:ubiquinone biosynthesis protein
VGTVVLYAAGYVLWPLVLRAIAARVLGVRVGRISGTLSGVAGMALGSAASHLVPRGPGNLATFVTTALLGTLTCLTLINLLARPTTMGHLERTFTPPLHPVRALRRRLARTARCLEVIRIAFRHRLLSRLTSPPGRAAGGDDERLGRDLALALQEAGGIFVKLGQLLASRSDILPPAVGTHLARLQDNAGPVPCHLIRAQLQAELGRPPNEVFSRFDETPVAAASIAQVHRARLLDGREVVVKVQRPDVDKQIQRDLDIIVRLAHRLEETAGWARKIAIRELAHGLAANLREELDFRVEAENTATARTAVTTPGIRIPTVHDALSTRRVLVLEWLDGTPLREAGSQLSALRADRRRLAHDLLGYYLDQILGSGVFNTDPHAGNFLLLPDGQLAQLDFGSVGRLHRVHQLALAQLLLGLDRNQPELVRDALLDLATAPGGVDIDALDHALTQLLAARLGPGSRAGAEVFMDMLGLVTAAGLCFDPQLAGLFRSLLTLQGTLTIIDPDFLLVDAVRCLAGDVKHRLLGPGALGRTLTDDLLKLTPVLRRLPGRIDRIAASMERNQWGMHVRLLADETDTRFLTRLADRAVIAFMSASIGVVSALLVASTHGPRITANLTLPQLIGYVGLGVATILGLRVLVGITRDRVA